MAKSRQVTDLPVTEFEVADGDWDSNRVYPINLIVIHTEVGFKTSTEQRFDDPTSHVSANYGVNEDGTIDHYVDEDNVAYANGNYAVNQRAISIEHEDFGQPNSPRTDQLYQTSGKLVADICQFYGIPCDRQHIIKHSEVPYPTQCCDSLDIDRIIREAQGVLNPTPAPASPSPTENGDSSSAGALVSPLPQPTTPSVTPPEPNSVDDTPIIGSNTQEIGKTNVKIMQENPTPEPTSPILPPKSASSNSGGLLGILKYLWKLIFGF